MNYTIDNDEQSNEVTFLESLLSVMNRYHSISTYIKSDNGVLVIVLISDPDQEEEVIQFKRELEDLKGSYPLLPFGVDAIQTNAVASEISDSNNGFSEFSDGP